VDLESPARGAAP